MRRLTALAAALLATAPGIAQAAELPCLTPAEFSAVAGYALPTVIKGASERCAATLGPSAYLSTNGRTLAANYGKQRAKYWPGTKSVANKLLPAIGADKMLGSMSDASLQPILDGAVEGMLVQQIKLDRCKAIDRTVQLLSPLPADNISELVALGMGLVAAKGDKPKIGKLSICEA